MTPELTGGQLTGAEHVDLQAFLSRDREDVSEHIHVKFDIDRGRVAFYRSMGKAGDGEWIRTDMDARIRLENGDDRPDGLFLVADQAETVMTLLDRLRVEQSPTRLYIGYWQTNNSEMIENAGLDKESVFFRYRTDSGRENRIGIHDTYQVPSQRFGQF